MDESTDLLTGYRARNVSVGKQIKHENRHVVVHAQGEGGGISNAQVPFQNLTVGVALGAVVIIGLLLGALAWTVLVAAAVGLATWEVCERLRESDWQVPRPVLILGGQLMVWLSAYWGIDGLVMGLAATKWTFISGTYLPKRVE